MANTVYLDIGGSIFRTTKSTLINIPYFAAAERVDGLVNSKEEPYFVDRDPTYFRHILNWARNPDSIADLSFEESNNIKDDLLFYGIAEITPDEEPPTENIPPEEQPAVPMGRPESAIVNCMNSNDSIQCRYFIEDEKDLPIDSALFDRENKTPKYLRGLNLSWITQRIPLVDGKNAIPRMYDMWTDPCLQVPENIPLEDIKVRFEIGGTSRCCYRLDCIPYIHPKTTITVDGYTIVPLPFTNGHWPLMIFVPYTEFSIWIEKPKHPNVELVLRYRGCIINNQTVRHDVLTTEKEFIYEHMQSIDFENTTKVSIDNSFNVRYMIWKTDKRVRWVDIQHGGNNSNGFIVDRADFQFKERQRVGLEPLPDNWGSVYYCRKPHQYNVNNGIQLFRYGVDLCFPTPVSGTLWLICDEIVMMARNMIVYRYCS